MHIIILGAGVIGVTTAYALAKSGHRVEVLEQHYGPARECSFANGGQLSYTHAEPWANPSVLSHIIPWMFKSDAPLVFRPRADIEMIRWGLAFLRNCTVSRSHTHCKTMLELGLYSREQMHHIVQESNITFDYIQKGILHLFSDQSSFDAARRQAEFQATLAPHKEEELSPEACFAIEPAIAQMQKKIIGGLYSDVDESGDVYQFTEALAAYCEKELGVVFHYGERIAWLKEEGGRITHVESSQGHREADAYVMAFGAYSSKFLKLLGIRIPVYPMKGYSISLPAWEGAPEMSITDDAMRIVFSRLGDKLRAAGTAEFAAYDLRIRKKRVQPLINAVEQIFPKANLKNVEKWSCLRPQTPDGPPIIGQTPIENLYLNTGHGTLGWTQSAGSAAILADIINGETPAIPTGGLALGRY